MQTTLDLPEAVFVQLNAQATLRGISVKELAAQLILQGLSGQAGTETPATPRQRSPLPLIHNAMTGIPIPALSRDEIARIEEEEEIARVPGSAGC